MLLAALLALSGMAAAVAEEAAPALTLQPGDALHGFTVAEVYPSTLLSSTIYIFDHEYSGAKLVYVQNDDPEAAFSIGYHTPQIDETDTNHVFEHAILSSSAKYPSSDIFFDMDSRAYQTYVNANTYLSVTRYPLSSLSEDQLLKMMDVYMSCMVAPAILTDDRIFRREAIRYELDDPAGDITVNGTVFAEDSGFLTSGDWRAINGVLDALYPGETASNMLGQAHNNYEGLTYEHTIETYERCYHFDNSQIFLYGKLNLDRFLAFLDEEYLSKYPAQGTDLSPWMDGPTAPGFVDVQVQTPAYEGDVVERNAVIAYAMDLSGKSDVALYQYSILADLFNEVGSPLYNAVLAQGIENGVSASIELSAAKPYITFSMSYADPSQKDALKAAVEAALAQVAAEGIDPAMLESMVKARERQSRLMRNGVNVGVELSEGFLLQWARSGDANFYRVYEQALNALRADATQLTIRQMALDLLTPARSALVTAVPTPGLAEQHDQALTDYLSDMKASMSQEALEAMAAETAAFNEWNMTENHNSAFMIAPGDLPDPAKAEWSKEERDGIQVYRGATALEGVGKYAVYFDLSGMSREEIIDLVLAGSYRLQMDTPWHSAAELNLLWNEYISDFSTELVYPNEAAGENHRPMLALNWASLTSDFEESLSLVLEVYTQTDFSDAEMLKYLTAVSADGYDMSRQSGSEIAYELSHANVGLRADCCKFQWDVCGQDCYNVLTEALEGMSADEEYAASLAARYESASGKAFTSDNLIFMCVAPADEIEHIIDRATAALCVLPEKEEAAAAYALPEVPKSVAVCIDASMNHTNWAGDFMADPDFTGAYLPFFYALGDRYATPVFRFNLGAYGASLRHQYFQGCLYAEVYSDPNVRATLDALKAMPEALRDMEITQADLDGYILNAYSIATSPVGMLNEVMYPMQYDVLGMDAERAYAARKTIKDAVLTDQAAAAEHIAAIMADGGLCMAGNEALIRDDADAFDQVISLRHGDGTEG